MTKDILDYEGNVIGQLTLPDETCEEVWAEKLAVYSTPPKRMTVQEIISKKITEAENFGAALMSQFAVENVMMGITQAGKTRDVVNYLHRLSHFLMTGSLYAAISEIDAMLLQGVPVDLDPFVSEARITEYRTKIASFLGTT